MRVLSSLFGREAANWMRTALLSGTTAAARQPSAIRDWYDALAAYYHANDLYGVLRDQRVASALADESLRAIRSPAFRATEFYVAHLWPGALADALPLEAENTAIVDPIAHVWRWSNLAAKKSQLSRQYASLGDLFLKVVAGPRGDRVYFQSIDPRDVTDYSKDERGNITSIRVDTPGAEVDVNGLVIRRYTHVETWDKASLAYRTWVIDGDSATLALGALGRPLEELDIRTFGVDFVPFVHAPFRDVGDLRGQGCYVPVLDKIDELNRVSTRLHRMAFRNVKVVWALRANGTDSTGRPLPAPRVPTAEVTNHDGTSSDVLDLGDDALLRLPGNSDLVSLVPLLPYDALLNVAREQLDDIETDLPEILWYRLARDSADASGRAIRLRMKPAESRVIEARGNGEDALIRANQMALSIGEHLGLWSVGSFDAGDLEHGFAPRDVFPLTDLDDAEAHRARAQAAQSYAGAGLPLSFILTDALGKSDKDAAAILQQAEQAARLAAERAAAMFDPQREADGEGEDDNA